MARLSAAGFTLIWACAKEVNPVSMSGTAMGLANMGGFLGAAIMQPVFGWALDQKWQGMLQDGTRVYPLAAYHFAFTIVLAVLITTWLSIFLMKESYGWLKH